MNCPFCNEEMRNGYIYGDRYPLKWLPEKKNLVLGLWAMGGDTLGEGGFVDRPRVKANKCNACNKLIIDLNEEYSV